MANVKLTNQPIVEMVCDFKFDLENLNDANLPFKIYEGIKNDFPKISKVMPTRKVIDNSQNILNPVTFFTSKDEDSVIQVGFNMFAINIVNNYQSWAVTKKVILKNYSIYLDKIKPKSLNSINIKAINKFHLPQNNDNKIDLKNYFNFIPPAISPNNLISAFGMHVESVNENEKDILSSKISTILPDADKPNNFALLLELSYIMNKKNGIELNEVEKWLEIAHAEIFSAFKNSLTEDYFKSFK